MVDFVKMLSHRKGDASTYRPTAGAVCLISSPNCDDENGYTYGEFEVLWTDDLFILYRKDGCWPVLNKWEHIRSKPLDGTPAAPVSGQGAKSPYVLGVKPSTWQEQLAAKPMADGEIIAIANKVDPRPFRDNDLLLLNFARALLDSRPRSEDSRAPFPSNEELEAVAEGHVGHPADFAADVLERWGGWPMGVLGYGGSGVLSSEDSRAVQFKTESDLAKFLDSLHATEGDSVTNQKWEPAQRALSALATSAAPVRHFEQQPDGSTNDVDPVDLEAGAAPSSGESADERDRSDAIRYRFLINNAPAAHSSAPSDWRKQPMPTQIDGELANAIMDAPCNWKGNPTLFDAILMGHTMACEQGAVLAMKYLAATEQPIAASAPSELHKAATAFLADIEAHDFGGIPEGPEADRLRTALAAPAPTGESLSAPKPFAFFVQPSGFGPFIECKPTQAGCFPAYRSLPVQGVPEGWQLVPKEATLEMCDATQVKIGGCYSCSAQIPDWGACKEIYADMLSAAPAPTGVSK